MLGVELNNVVCSRLGTMLYLDIKNGKEKTKTSQFQQFIGVTLECIKRSMKV